LLDWFDVVDCMEKHEYTRKQRQQTTGEWLFAEQPYIDWRLSRNRFLWLNGKRECDNYKRGELER
jgi:hypothetical protein